MERLSFAREYDVACLLAATTADGTRILQIDDDDDYLSIHAQVLMMWFERHTHSRFGEGVRIVLKTEAFNTTRVGVYGKFEITPK